MWWELRVFAFFLALSEVNTFLIFQYFVWTKEENLNLHQFRRKLAILMMFNTYDVEEGEETEHTHQHRSKRNRRESPYAHDLITAPNQAKCYLGKPTYKWDLTASQKYQQQRCFTGCGNRTRTYFHCNRFASLCKPCHIKHVLTVHSGDNNSDSNSSQNSPKTVKSAQKQLKYNKTHK